MRIFVIGPSASGKSTHIAPAIQEALTKEGFISHVVEAGGWVREAVGPRGEQSRSEHLAKLVKHARQELGKSKNCALDWIRTHGQEDKVNIIVGVRNPFDFGVLFDWTRDILVWIEGTAYSTFEVDGLAAIKSQLDFLRGQDIPVRKIEVKSLTAGQAEDLATEDINRLIDWVKSSTPQKPTPETLACVIT